MLTARVRGNSYQVRSIYEAARVDLDDIIRSTTVLVAMNCVRTYLVRIVCTGTYQYLVRVPVCIGTSVRYVRFALVLGML